MTWVKKKKKSILQIFLSMYTLAERSLLLVVFFLLNYVSIRINLRYKLNSPGRSQLLVSMPCAGYRRLKMMRLVGNLQRRAQPPSLVTSRNPSPSCGPQSWLWGCSKGWTKFQGWKGNRKDQGCSSARCLAVTFDPGILILTLSSRARRLALGVRLPSSPRPLNDNIFVTVLECSNKFLSCG